MMRARPIDLQHLPDEMKLNILEQTDDKMRLFKLACTSKHFLSFTEDRSFWRRAYEKEFALMPNEHEAKVQFYFAYQYKHACQLSPERAQIRFKRIFARLQQRENKSWEYFYLGEMQYKGQGVTLDKKRGLHQLQLGLNKNDWRAALSIVEIIKAHKGHHDQKIQLLAELGPDTIAKLLPNLQTAYERGCPMTATAIAYLYKSGTGVEKDPEKASVWLHKAIRADIKTAIADLVYLGFSSSNHSISITDLDSLSDQYQLSAETKAEIEYHKGLLHFQHDAMDQGWYALQMASIGKHTTAARMLGKREFKRAEAATPLKAHKHITLAMEYFSRGFADHVNIKEYYTALELRLDLERKLLHKKYDPEEKQLAALKKEFKQGNHYCATLIGEYYVTRLTNDSLYNIDITARLNNPEMIGYLQLAAQSGSTPALNKLEELAKANTKSPYVYCALGIIYLCGILHSSRTAASNDRALEYFLTAAKLDNKAIHHYLSLCVEEGLICKEAESMLNEQIRPPLNHTAPLLKTR